MAQKYFATIEPGLEEALLAEVRELGGKRANTVKGGVEFDATNTVFYRMALNLRCANRLWLRLDEFRARDVQELYRKTNRIEWARLLPRMPKLDIRASTRESRINHSGKVEDTVAAGISDALGAANRATKPFTLLARLVDDRCELSLDASGELLFRRGYKQDVGHAPLRESVAAALLRLAGWTPDVSLYDPMCGSGTFVIEAAQMSAGICAGLDRDYDFHRWANFRAELWDEVVTEDRPTFGAQHYGSDADPEVVAAANANAERAGVTERTSFAVATVGKDDLPFGREAQSLGLVVANPPWNQRISDPSLQAARALIEQFPAGPLAFLAPRSFRAPDGFEAKASFELGGSPVRWWVRAAH